MSDSERSITDTRGKFLQVVENGQQVDDSEWTDARILLSNRRLILISSQGKRTLPLSAIEGIGGRYDVNERVERTKTYHSIEFDEDDVLLVAAPNDDGFERDLYSALLDRAILLLRHPALEDGVGQNAEWEKARIALDGESVTIETASGGFVDIEVRDVTEVNTAERTVMGESRRVVEVEHTTDGTSVVTNFSGPDRYCSIVQSLFSESDAQNRAELDLERSERQVLMALYSGVSPFEIPGFTGTSVEEVEETFDRLVELGVLHEVRKRREVELTDRGRNVASDAMNED